MGRSAWKIWLHPRLTRAELERMDADLVNADSLHEQLCAMTEEKDRIVAELGSARSALTRLEFDHESLSQSNLALAQKCAEQQHKLQAMHNTLQKANDELSSLRDTERRISEFEAILGRVEEMKSNYENRIAKLRKALKECQQKNDELKTGIRKPADPIDMTSDAIPLSDEIADKEGDDWLENLK